jgi:hypothetical protein
MFSNGQWRTRPRSLRGNDSTACFRKNNKEPAIGLASDDGLFGYLLRSQAIRIPAMQLVVCCSKVNLAELVAQFQGGNA